LKEALVNFIALLGWTAGDDREIYSLKELIASFSLERVNKSGAVFDIEKLNWLNAEHLRSKPDNELISILRESLKNSKYGSGEFSDIFLLKVITAMKERVSFVKEFFEKGFYFFEEPENYEESAIKKRWKQESPSLLLKFAGKIEQIETPVKNEYEKALKETAEEMKTGAGNIIHPLRLAVSGVSGGPGVYDILDIIGKEQTIKRINKIINTIS
jgi:glutamyl-tRNA synthetase